MQASRFPVGWHARLTTIARAEVKRLQNKGVRVDLEDGTAFAIAEAWITLDACEDYPASFYGLARVVIRRRLISEYVQAPMRQRNGGPGAPSDGTRPTASIASVSLSTLEPYADGKGGLLNQSLTCNPWSEAVDQIAFAQAIARYRKARHARGCAAHVTRQRRSQARKAIIAFARQEKTEHDV